MELLLVLGIPLMGSALLALGGHRGRAPEINAMMSLLTFACGGGPKPPMVPDTDPALEVPEGGAPPPLASSAPPSTPQVRHPNSPSPPTPRPTHSRNTTSLSPETSRELALGLSHNLFH